MAWFRLMVRPKKIGAMLPIGSRRSLISRVVKESPERLARKDGNWSFECRNPVTGEGRLLCTPANDASAPELRVKMKNSNQATHNHKRVGAVIVLQSTRELAEVQIPSSGDHFWVKLTDLTELAETAKPA